MLQIWNVVHELFVELLFQTITARAKAFAHVGDEFIQWEMISLTLK